jgi:transmembrane sensor
MNINETHISKYLSGELSEVERQAFEQWLENEQNKKKYNSYKRVWDISNQDLLPEPVFDTQKALAKVLKKINQERIVDFGKKTNVFSLWKWSAAAAVLIAVGLGAFYQFFYNPIISETNQLAIAKKIKLDDGSIVSLEPKATLNYPKYFRDTIREISFDGKAFFEIAKDPNRPFVVSMGASEVRVLGTSFNIAHTDSLGIEVAVVTGKVGFGSKKDRGKYLFLNPGESARMKDGEVALVEPPVEEIPEEEPKPKKKSFKKMIYVWDGNLYDGVDTAKLFRENPIKK